MKHEIRRRLVPSLFLFILIGAVLPLKAVAQPLAQGKGKFLGASTSSDINRSLGQYWNQVTPGNNGKWGSVTSTRGQYTWTNLDTIYNYATRLGLIYKHHVLVWGSQQPYWLDGLDSANQRLEVETWIHLVGQRYPKMSFVDVVNEPFHTPLPSYKKALGGDGTTGWDWVITAFQLARQNCAPGVKLLLNEYNVLHNNAVTTNYLTVINLLKDRGLIDGIGIQGHYFEFRSNVGAISNTYMYDVNTIKANLDRLSATGLPVYMTEFDIDEPDDATQLAQYKVYFPIFWSHPGVKGITLWGYVQNDVWTAHPDTYLLRTNGSERPALQWLRTYIQSPLPPSPISPMTVNGIPRNPVLLWHSSQSATSYHVQVSDNTAFSATAVDTTVADTLVQLKPLAANSRYYWRVSAVNTFGASDYSTTAGFVTGDLISAIGDIEVVPAQFALCQNYPNPFNPSTSFEFRVSSFGFVTLKVFDVLGREIATLVNELRSPGTYSVRWDASSFTSGVYFYRLQAGAFVETKQMVLMK
jgi:endo-1,4-beta-xylanase